MHSTRRPSHKSSLLLILEKVQHVPYPTCSKSGCFFYSFSNWIFVKYLKTFEKKSNLKNLKKVCKQRCENALALSRLCFSSDDTATDPQGSTYRSCLERPDTLLLSPWPAWGHSLRAYLEHLPSPTWSQDFEARLFFAFSSHALPSKTGQKENSLRHAPHNKDTVQRTEVWAFVRREGVLAFFSSLFFFTLSFILLSFFFNFFFFS